MPPPERGGQKIITSRTQREEKGAKMNIRINNYTKRKKIGLMIKGERRSEIEINDELIIQNVHEINLYNGAKHTVISYKEKYERTNQTSIYIDKDIIGIEIRVER